MLCHPKSPELPSAEATWLRARRAAGLPERTGLPLRSRWRNGSRVSAHEWNAWSPPVHGPWMPPGMCIPGQPVGISTYIDPVLTYLACWAVFGVWPTLFVLYKLLQ